MDADAKMYKLYDEDGNCALDEHSTIGTADEHNSWINWTSGIIYSLSTICGRRLDTAKLTCVILKREGTLSWQATLPGWHSVPAHLLDREASLLSDGFRHVGVNCME